MAAPLDQIGVEYVQVHVQLWLLALKGRVTVSVSGNDIIEHLDSL